MISRTLKCIQSSVPDAFTEGERYRVLGGLEYSYVCPIISKKRNEFGQYDVYVCEWTDAGALFIPEGTFKPVVAFSN